MGQLDCISINKSIEIALINWRCFNKGVGVSSYPCKKIFQDVSLPFPHLATRIYRLGSLVD